MFVVHLSLYICAIPIPRSRDIIPIPIPISSPKAIPISWNSRGNLIPTGIPTPMHTSSLR